jgi:hypothetical protein
MLEMEEPERNWIHLSCKKNLVNQLRVRPLETEKSGKNLRIETFIGCSESRAVSIAQPRASGSKKAAGSCNTTHLRGKPQTPLPLLPWLFRVNLKFWRVGRARLNAPDSKSDIVARRSGVRIPHSPPDRDSETSTSLRRNLRKPRINPGLCISAARPNHLSGINSPASGKLTRCSSGTRSGSSAGTASFELPRTSPDGPERLRETLRPQVCLEIRYGTGM